MTTKPTARDLELLEMATIASQMPVQFANGATWNNFEGQCRGCGQVLPDESVHGSLTKITPSMVAVEASGVCSDRMLLTRYVYRLHDDMRITGPRGDQWVTWGGKKPTLFDRIFAAFFGA